MGIHIINPEISKKLEIQQKRASASSLLIALLSITLMAMIFGIILLHQQIKEPPVLVYYTPEKPIQPIDPVREKPSVSRKPSAPPKGGARAIAVNTVSEVSIAVPDTLNTEPSLNFGEGDFGEGFGDNGFNNFNGPTFNAIPAILSKRCDKIDRMKRLLEVGGNDRCEIAVIKALDYFKQTQNPDGSWDNRNKPAMTGLVLLAYLGHCETPKSKNYGETVTKAITYLVNLGLKNDGVITENKVGNGWIYEHAICTYALAEATTFCKEIKYKDLDNLSEVTRKAAQFIIDNQASNGGWAYSYAKPTGHTDLSIVGWQMQALKAAKHSGVELNKLESTIRQAIAYVEGNQSQDGGFNYIGNGGSGERPLTGTGVLALQIWGKEKSREVRNGIEFLEKNVEKFDYAGQESNIYSHYYNIQAMLNAGGKAWEKYNNIVRDPLLQAQLQDGSWPKPGHAGHGGATNSPIYRTALCTLMLEAYYRFLPSSDKKR